MLGKQCHKFAPSPSHHEFIDGINLPFPVMGGKNDIVLPTLVVCFVCESCVRHVCSFIVCIYGDVY